MTPRNTYLLPGLITAAAVGCTLALAPTATASGTDRLTVKSWSAMRGQAAKSPQVLERLTEAKALESHRGVETVTTGQTDSAGVTAAGEAGPQGLYASNTAGVIAYLLNKDGSVGRTESHPEWSSASWGPAGDRLSVTPAGSTGYHLENPDGTSPLDYPDADSQGVAGWSPFGDGFARQHEGMATAPMVAQSVTPGLRQTIEAGSAAYGPAEVSPYGGETIVREALDGGGSRIVLIPTWFPMDRHGQTARFAPVDFGLADYAPGDPAVGQAPGTSIYAPDSATYLAFPGVVPATTTAKLFVDHQDGVANGDYDYKNAKAVADIGSNCRLAPPEFSPNRRELAYVKAVGPVDSPCTQTQLRIVRAGANGRYDAADITDRLVSTSPAGDPFTSLSWKASTALAPAWRIGGADRIDVSVIASLFTWNDQGADVAVISGSLAYADALAGGPLAGEFGGPVMLTGAAALDSRVAAELQRALPAGKTVYVTGGTASVSNAVVTSISNLGYNVVRLGGADRYNVAVNIAKRMDALRGSAPRTAFVSAGTAFADALVAGPAAVHEQGSVLLSNGTLLPQVTKDYLDSIQTPVQAIYGVGGAGSASVAGRAKSEALSGSDRYAVSLTVANRFFTGENILGLADGRNWPDAVSGGASMSAFNSPILLVNGSTLPGATQQWIKQARSSIDIALAFGGPASVPDGPLLTAATLSGTQTPYFGPDMQP